MSGRAFRAAVGGHDGSGTGPAPGPVPEPVTGTGTGTEPGGCPGDGAAWARLLRVSALFTVPGDALAGAAASGHRPNRGTALAAGSSLCLYEAGMALNDYADRHIDAVERPSRPLPSGRITPGSALAASAALTASGLGLAAVAGRGALLTASALAATVWAYDLGLKHTALGPATMAAARGLDLVLGAVASASEAGARQGPRRRSSASGAVLRAAGLLGTHTFAVTAVSRRETLGAAPAVPLAALGAVGAVAAATWGAVRPGRAGDSRGRAGAGAGAGADSGTRPGPVRAAVTASAAAYAVTAARPLVAALPDPSPALLQRAVGGGIRATIPLQAALNARAGRSGWAVAVLALTPAAARLSRKVSPT
ncbi:SCO3242 family prenyltransferase [Streptomyces marispadix]|uniref:UbiA family prenyltransferase n=1 Tax=Streptomyces marispadix TaxID=2922868 RepID=A0ABS9T4P6_9ACTN|nr:UbiA family prenyltransferase [Streptomyces marispadix]MCH6163487.1 UbiA family prenyltransferase [Streptomyces marispadix]